MNTEDIKELFTEVMYELKSVDGLAYDILIMRKGLHNVFKKRYEKVERYNASRPILKIIHTFK